MSYPKSEAPKSPKAKSTKVKKTKVAKSPKSEGVKEKKVRGAIPNAPKYPYIFLIMSEIALKIMEENGDIPDGWNKRISGTRKSMSKLTDEERGIVQKLLNKKTAIMEKLKSSSANAAIIKKFQESEEFRNQVKPKEGKVNEDILAEIRANAGY